MCGKRKASIGRSVLAACPLLRPQINDFGLSRVLQGDSISTQSCGTVPYMASVCTALGVMGVAMLGAQPPTWNGLRHLLTPRCLCPCQRWRSAVHSLSGRLMPVLPPAPPPAPAAPGAAGGRPALPRS